MGRISFRSRKPLLYQGLHLKPVPPHSGDRFQIHAVDFQQYGLRCVICEPRGWHVCEDDGTVERSNDATCVQYRSRSVRTSGHVLCTELGCADKQDRCSQCDQHSQHHRIRFCCRSGESTAPADHWFYQRADGCGYRNASWC